MTSLVMLSPAGSEAPKVDQHPGGRITTVCYTLLHQGVYHAQTDLPELRCV